MGMFTRPEIFAEHFKEDEPFQLLAIREGMEMQTEYGEGKPTLLQIEVPGGEGPKWFSIFGDGIAQQCDQFEEGDLPRQVMVSRVKTGQGREVKKLLPTEHAEPK